MNWQCRGDTLRICVCVPEPPLVCYDWHIIRLIEQNISFSRQTRDRVRRRNAYVSRFTPNETSTCLVVEIIAAFVTQDELHASCPFWTNYSREKSESSLRYKLSQKRSIIVYKEKYTFTYFFFFIVCFTWAKSSSTVYK